MWVLGDLKDQLGVAHRKPRKQRKTEGNLEGAPMFQGQHSRSFSEFSNPNTGYEPAMLNSPAPSAPLRQTYLDTPPMSEAIELPPREPSVQYAQVGVGKLVDYACCKLSHGLLALAQSNFRLGLTLSLCRAPKSSYLLRRQLQ